jgi:hypothetical protein
MSLRRHLLYLSFFFASWRILLFVIGLLSPLVLHYQPSFPYFDSLLPSFGFPQWIYSWANFDGVHYLTIAQKGYIGTGLIQAFFPLYPYVLLHTLHLISMNFNLLFIGLMLSNLFAYSFIIFWFYWMYQKKGARFAWVSCCVLLLFPTSFFLGALYTESLFMLLVVVTFWAAEQKKWWLAGLCAAAASATRVVGVFLVPAVLIELWMSYCATPSVLKLKSPLFQKVQLFVKSSWRSILLVCVGMTGILGYMAYLYYHFHDPLYFFHVQAAFGTGRQQSFVLYPQVVVRYIRILTTYQAWDWSLFAYFQEFLAGVFGFLGLLAAFKYTKLSYTFFGLMAFLVPTLTGTFSSLPRYLLVCFPLYLLLTRFIQKNRLLGVIWLSLSALFLIINTILFIQGYWVA